MAGFVMSTKLRLCCSKLATNIPQTLLFSQKQTPHYIPLRQYPKMTVLDRSGKTTVTILNREEDAPLMIDAYSPIGFRLNNNMRVVGPIAIFPHTVLSWNIAGPKDVTAESLVMFSLLAPRLDLLIVGVGETTQNVDLTWVKALKSKGVHLEVYTTEHACSIFNFLNAEGRAVAAAIIPPSIVKVKDGEVFDTNRKAKQLFRADWA